MTTLTRAIVTGQSGPRQHQSREQIIWSEGAAKTHPYIGPTSKRGAHLSRHISADMAAITEEIHQHGDFINVLGQQLCNPFGNRWRADVQMGRDQGRAGHQQRDPLCHVIKLGIGFAAPRTVIDNQEAKHGAQCGRMASRANPLVPWPDA